MSKPHPLVFARRAAGRKNFKCEVCKKIHRYGECEKAKRVPKNS